MDVVYFDVLHVQHAQNTWGNNCFPLCPHVCPSADLMESFLLSLYSLRCCSIRDEGLRSLLSAVRSNPSALRELELHENHPGPSALQLFSELKKDPNCKHINISGLSWIHSHFIPCKIFLSIVYKTNNSIWCKNYFSLVTGMISDMLKSLHIWYIVVVQQLLSTVPVFV